MIHTYLRNHREAQGMGRGAAAEALGVSTAYLAKIEKGGHPVTAKEVIKIAGVYGISREEAIGVWRDYRDQETLAEACSCMEYPVEEPLPFHFDYELVADLAPTLEAFLGDRERAMTKWVDIHRTYGSITVYRRAWIHHTNRQLHVSICVMNTKARAVPSRRDLAYVYTHLKSLTPAPST